MFHGDTAGQQEARTAMPEIMKADFAETVPFQQPWKLRCDIVRLEPIPNIIYANIFNQLCGFSASIFKMYSIKEPLEEIQLGDTLILSHRRTHIF